MSYIDNPQTPGIEGLNELTSAEELWVQSGTAGIVKLSETTAPTAESSIGQIYVKSSDSKLYYLDSAGVEIEVGSGSGAVASVFGRTGAVIAVSGDYTTDLVTEATNLYYTDARVSANPDVTANTAKVGITTTQANDITANNAKVTESTTVTAPLVLTGYDVSIPASTTSVDGYLTATDWTTFNNKEDSLGNPSTDGYVLSSTIAGVRSWTKGGGTVGGVYGINVETLSADKTLVAGTDPIYQYLDPSTANWTITLDTASAVAGDRFTIKNNDVSNSSYFLIIQQGTTTIDSIYAQGIKKFIFDGTNWQGVANGVKDTNIAIGNGTRSTVNGVAIGDSSDGHQSGTAVGYDALAYTSGVAIGFGTRGGSYAVAVGYNANGYYRGTTVGYGTDGSYNGTAVGYDAHGFRNGTSVGYQAGTNLNSTYLLTNKNILLGYQAGYNLTQPSAWVASTAYTAGQFVRPTTANTYNYEVTTAGTSGTAEPTWNTTLGGTTTDGTVTWTTVSQRGNNNIIIGYDIEGSANDADTLNIGNIITGDLSTGDITVAGNIGATNLSGTNTGDQDLSTYATLTGIETLTNKTLTSPVINSPTGIVWADIDKTTSDIADITTKSHTSLTDIGTNTHAQIDTHIASVSNPHGVTATQVGLGNVDNTSDTTKNSATATLTNKTITDSSNTIITHTNVNAQTGTAYTLVLSDDGKLVTMNNASANTLTVPTNATVAFPVGTQIDISMIGAGKTTIAGASGVTINSKGGNLSINGQYVGVSLVQTATDVWLLLGDLVA